MTTLDDVRRLAIDASLFAPTTLERALGALGFVQADPDLLDIEEHGGVRIVGPRAFLELLGTA